MVKGPPSRGYKSPLRRAQAARTRNAVIGAARELFLAQGYAATSIDAVAGRAGVSSETIYVQFRSKRGLLSGLLDVSIAGDDEPVPVIERAWAQGLRALPTVRARLRVLAREGARILERRAPIDELLRTAGAADPAVAAMAAESARQRLVGQRALLRIVIGEDRLRAGLTEATAGDILFAIGSPDTWRTLVVDRGWTPARYERWYVATLERLFLD
ncbi:MAG: TetR/AcrR family transcriptional regulator [Chloroflexi bacterium]|nr:TetR/AcrR family transcriptional regulator [Chloroflexota bacterium]